MEPLPLLKCEKVQSSSAFLAHTHMHEERDQAMLRTGRHQLGQLHNTLHNRVR